MIVVLTEEWNIPGQRPELEAAHRTASETLRQQPGFVSGRLIQFLGGPYRFLHEGNWESREAFDRFYESPTFTEYRAAIEPYLSSPMMVQIHSVKVED